VEVSGGDYEAFSGTVWSNGYGRVDIHFIRGGTYTLSGVVSEMIAGVLTPVAGVLVEAWACNEASTGCKVYTDGIATTDGNGFYSIPGLWAGEVPVWVSKPGYAVEDPRPVCGDNCDRIVPIFTDTPLDIRLVRP
jgi:hypothetical protein